MGCFWGHKWKYAELRKEVYLVTKMLGAISISEPHEETQTRQYRTCEKCGIIEDTEIREY